MLKLMPQNRLLRRYARLAGIIGWAFVVVSILLIAVGVLIGGFAGAVIVAFAGALTPAAIVNAFLDPLLREDTAKDLRDLFGVREDLYSSGIKQYRHGERIDRGDVLQSADEIKAVPLHIERWKNSVFPDVVKKAAADTLDLRIYILQPESDHLLSYADRLQADPDRLRADLKALPDEILDAWDRGSVLPTSSLQIFWTWQAPTVGVLLGDAAVEIEIGAPLQEEKVGARTFSIIFARTSDSYIWAREQIQSIDSLETTPVMAGARPLPKEGA